MGNCYSEKHPPQEEEEMIKTSRMGEQVQGIILDITVKNNPSHVLSPTWDMVMSYKRGKITWEKYREEYYSLLRKRWKTRKDEFLQIIKTAEQQDVYLACFCKNEDFCHRSLAREILLKIAEHLALQGKNT